MTTLVVLSALIIASIALAGLIVFIEYPRSAVDQTRNELFGLRSELFELARGGQVSFEHRGYRAARDLLNGMIRYAHDVSALHLLFANLFASREARILRKVVNKSIQNDLGSLPKAARADVERILNRASAALSRLVVFRSVGLSSVFACYATVHGFCAGVKSLMDRIKTTRVNSTPRVHAAYAHKVHMSNVEESMHEVMDHGPMSGVPRLVVREAGRYARKYDLHMLPVAA